MIETNVPDDIRQYKTKLVGPLTLRQLICICIAMALDLLIYAILSPFMGDSADANTFLAIVLIVIDLPIVAFTRTVQGISMEQYLKFYLIYNFMAPLHRYEKTNLCSVQPDTLTDKEKKQKEKQHKVNLQQHPNMKPYA